MSNVQDLILKLKKLEVKLKVEDHQLILDDVKGQLYPELLDDLRGSKQEIISYIQNLTNNGSFKHIAKVAIQDHYELSHAQKRLWLIDQLSDGKSAYNISSTFGFKHLHKGAFEKAFLALIERHEILRTAFISVDGVPRQKIYSLEEFPFKINSIDISEHPNLENEVAEIAEKEAKTRFNLSSGPLLRVTVVQTSTDDFVLFLTMHHIISDAWSMSVMEKEFGYLYSTFLSNTMPKLPLLPIQYKDYAYWQNEMTHGGKLASSKKYWLDQFSGNIPVLQLPSDFSRPPTKTHKGADLNFTIDRSIYTSLKNFGLSKGATPFMTLLTVVKTLFYKYTSQNDIIVGTPVAGRDHPDLNGQIGFYINTLALRTRFLEDDSFSVLLTKVKNTALGAFRHQQYPFDHLVDELDLERDMSRSALFDVMVSMKEIENQTESDVEETDVAFAKPARSISKFDMSITFAENAGNLHVNITYSKDIFTSETIQRLATHFKILSRSIILNTEEKINKLSFISTNERTQILNKFNTPYTSAVSYKTVVEQFETQVAKTPNAIAVTSEGISLTYNELNERSNQLAHYLKEQYEVNTEDLIGISLNRSAELIVGIWGILKSGAAYVPIDPAYPKTRKNYLIEDSNVKLVITEEACVEDIANATTLDIYNTTIYTKPVVNLPLQSAGSNLIYVIYTSGTTGNPKGSLIEHGSVANLCSWLYDLVYSSYEENATTLLTASYSFDSSVKQLFPPFLNGGCLVIPSEETKKNPAALAEVILKENVNVLDVTPSYLPHVLASLKERNLQDCHLGYTLVGGEALENKQAIEYQSILGETSRLVNVYGVTEATVDSTCQIATGTNIGKNVPIGKPLPNTKVVLLDNSHNLMPIGIPGEICIGGAGVGRGYLNKESLTKKKFIADPFEEGARLYKTGDMGRWMADGTIEYLGRSDSQVKIRGYRIEVEEIRHALLTIKEISSAFVDVKSSNNDKALVAYYSLYKQSEITKNILKSKLSELLPSFMIPSYFMELEKLPLTANGKLDKKALSTLDTFSLDTTNYVAPRNAYEEGLVSIWEEVLAREKIGVTDNFFELGGHSLKAFQVMSRIFKVLHTKVTLKDIFSNPTIESLATHIHTLESVDYIAIPSIAHQESYEVSHAQKRLWILQQFEESQSAYNMPGIYPLESLDVAAFQRAFDTLISRHEILRTTFVNINGEPRQIVHTETPFDLEYEDLRSHNDREEVLENQIIEACKKDFDLENGPLIQGKLFQMEGEDYVFFLNMHHIISDGWSIKVLIGDVLALYEAYTKGASNPLTPLRIQYKDYAHWQNETLRTGGYKEAQSYWLRQLGGELPVLELPLDYPRPAVKTYNGDSIRFGLSEEITKELKVLSRHQGSTLFITLLATVKALLYRYTGQKDIIIGTPTAGRDHEELEDQIGFYINTLALRTQFSGDEDFLALVNQVQATTLDAQDHQSYPFDMLVDELDLERDMSRSPLFDVMVILQNVNDAAEDGDTTITEESSSDIIVSKYDLDISFVEKGERIQVSINYNPDLFDAARIARMQEHYQTLLGSIIANPSRAINQLNYISETEQQLLLTKFNLPYKTIDVSKTVVNLFEEQVSKYPDSIAVTFQSNELTYATLNKKVNQLAAYLLTSKTTSEQSKIGIYIERSEWQIISMLAILKIGGCYVPVDRETPIARAKYMLENAEVNCLITDVTIEDTLLDKEIALISLEEIQESLTQYSDENLNIPISSDKLAYILYTSGTTGMPKGVMISHHALSDYTNTFGEYFKITYEDKIIQQSSLAFDVSVEEIFPILCVGGQLFLMKEGGRDIDELTTVIHENKITLLSATPLIINELNERAAYLNSLRILISGGDKLKVGYIDQLIDQVAIYNTYGPTEATVCITYHHIENLAAIDVIGKPLANHKIHLLDANAQPVAIGIPGELYVEGYGLAEGYMNSPLETLRSFQKLPDISENRLYKTGDKGVWLTDGSIKFLGRTDTQFKIRGYRIELDEIENTLIQHTKISDAVMSVIDVEGEEKYLVAYVESQDAVEVEEIKEYLKNRLPHYMIPRRIIVLDEFPMNNNGKLDRKALPSPDTFSLDTTNYVAPRNEYEEGLVGIWEEVLAREKIGVTDNFFELGGHSLKAFQVMSRIFKVLHTKVTLKDIFSNPTIESLAAHISTSESVNYTSNTTVVVAQESYEVSHAQKRLWILEQFEESKSVYNIPGIYPLESLDADSFQRAFDTLISRHEILRTTFVNIDGEPRQIIHEEASFNIQYKDFRNRGSKEEAIEKQIIASCKLGFDLEKGPLIRGTLFHLEKDDYIFFLNMHHIISDGWSIKVLIQEVLALYEAYKKGASNPLPPLRIQYKDYAHWQNEGLRTGAYKEAQSYWLTQLGGELPVLELPLDYPRPAVKTYNGDSIRFGLSEEVSKELKALSIRQGSTLFITLLATVKALLYRYTGQEDIIVGTPTAGRANEELEGQIGFYINTLALRTQFSGNKDFLALLTQVQETTLDAQDHQSYPFDMLVDELDLERDMSRSPLFDVMVILQNVTDAADEDETKITEESDVGADVSKYDLNIGFIERGERIQVNIIYNPDLFDAARIERMKTHYKTLLASIIANPKTSISQYNYISEAEQHQLLKTFNDTKRVFPSKNTVQSIFEAQVTKNPNAPAVSFQGNIITYNELNERSNRIAQYLRTQHTITPDTLIGVMMDRSDTMIITIMGIIKSGAAYVPIDPDYPQDRVNYIVSDSGIILLIHDEKTLNHTFSCPKILFKELSEATENVSSQSVDNINTSNDLMYVIYTSGTTGNPKGVMIAHTSLLNLCSWHQEYYNVNASSRATLYAKTGFDASVWEIWPYLLSGGCLYPIRNEVSLNIAGLKSILLENKITHSFFPTIICEQLIEEGVDLGDTMILTGGDKLQKYANNVINNYGPTESTVVATSIKLQEYSGNTIPIGKPISNTQIYILDDNLQLQPIGIKGEICISGKGLSRGYLHREELTNSKFIPHPFIEGEKLYKTGDLGKWRADGNIEFLDRKDTQVKIRGYRIELGEIENTLQKLSGIDKTIVLAHSDDTGNKVLIAYYSTLENYEEVDFRAKLEAFLPIYMIPSHFVKVEEFLVTPNGKLDRKALPKIDTLTLKTNNYLAPRNEYELRLVDIWEEVLGREKIGVRDNFFELGGHSLKAVKLSSVIHKKMGVNVDLVSIYNHPSIETLHAYLIQEGKIESNLLIQLNKTNLSDHKLFLIPPIGGSSTIYKNVATQLEKYTGCYGFQYKGFDGNTEIANSIEELAQEYYNEIANISVYKTEITVLGYSMGALIAFELIKLLENNGFTPKLILLDKGVKSTIKNQDLTKISDEELDELLQINLGASLEALNQQEIAQLKKFYLNNLKIHNDYRMNGTIQSDILTIESRNNDKNANMHQWSNYTKGNLKNEFAKGSHYEILNHENLNDVVTHIQHFISID
ncbi:non-ribosomal peptide synthetase [uncultured Kordia sp.]|uniref:non-ribosomal peptide synthetase n=1 Tax=uncultured Kordia sp. TaxID=507699 RepID=UPI00260E75FA|nr:non-ribosomal peptide synthetase [uncultured Kordia sp.]